MVATQVITRAHFLQRLSELCLRSGIRDLPTQKADQHILLKSALLTIGRPGPWREAEINERLQAWLQLTGLRALDHVKLRRYLVDAGYLARTPDGAEYRPNPGGWGLFEFEPAVEEVDVAAELEAARAEIERRKQAYLRKNRPD